MACIKMNAIPYKSGPAAMADLIGGQVMMFTADFAVTVLAALVLMAWFRLAITSGRVPAGA